MKFLTLFFLAFGALFANWQMFADGTETYLYNTNTGEVYVKVKKGGKNYEDVFVKMPMGVRNLEFHDLGQKAPNSQPPKAPSTPNALNPQNADGKSSQDLRMESIKKAQEMMQKTLDGMKDEFSQTQDFPKDSIKRAEEMMQKSLDRKKSQDAIIQNAQKAPNAPKNPNTPAIKNPKAPPTPDIMSTPQNDPYKAMQAQKSQEMHKTKSAKRIQEEELHTEGLKKAQEMQERPMDSGGM
ncbi:hypothetical protein [Helicobacter mustelae]|uniref:Putative periplasmic protein n=1 Tax=Helicobacter mustelae (strain ATCC 43772 / CCUG 25715 / CIP 103759 / LMG 18044 / NCTC 12198 / R85-136P) TaxID=679897 RepID=D3UI32_HELM1|nr:hypothetical protein [Helicobacter mustelae]CBG40155.1 Putative periplasmic protein [Helicobacter mustelae 12198]SQH71657.1 periplasmic protein [Helicobacter mustelae]